MASLSKKVLALNNIKPTLEVTRVSVSRLLTFVECHRKYYWRYVRNIEPKAFHIPFFVGSAFHKGLELFYSGVEEEDVLEQVQEHIEKYMEDIFVQPEEVGEVDKQVAAVMGMLRGYFVTHQEDKKWKVIQPEALFSFELKPFGIQFVGVIDLIFKRKTKGVWKTYVQEHKTASRITRDYLDRLPFDLQAMCYPLMANKCLGLKIAGISYNIVTKPRIRQKKNERFDEYIERVEEVYLSQPLDYFYREFLRYQPAKIEEAMQDVRMITEEILTYHDCLGSKVVDRSEWYRNSRACFNFNSRCPYFKLCKYGPKPEHLVFFKERKDNNAGKKEIREKAKKSKRRKPGDTKGSNSSK